MALAQLVQLPCACGCGRTAATLRVMDLPDAWQGLIRSALSTARLMGGAEARAMIPKIPDGANPLAYIPPEVISGALGLVRPECVTEELGNGQEA